MNTKYSINQTTKDLVFTGKPKLLKDEGIEPKDRLSFVSVFIPNSVATIDGTFRLCESLASIHIPNSVTDIGHATFRNCEHLAFVHIPNSTSKIGWLAFAYCEALTSIHIPNSSSTIDVWAFRNCTGLTSIHIPNCISTIDDGIFNACASVASAYIPNSVSAIEGLAFWSCSRLHKVCLSTDSKIDLDSGHPSFQPQTAILRPRLKPITSLQKKPACCVAKTSHSTYL